MSELPAWKRRFTAPTLRLPHWAAARPERLALVSNETGSLQAWTWDLATGERRPVTDEQVGVEEAFVTPDGDGVVWWHDPSGDERGHWLVAPFDGGEPRKLLPELPDAWSLGLGMVPGVVAFGAAHDEDYVVYVSVDGGPTREIHRHARPLGVGQEYPTGPGGLSTDGSLLCVRHSENGDILHHALRVYDVRTGDAVDDLVDAGLNLMPAVWSPVPGDPRLAVLHDRDEFERPAVWNLATGEREDLKLDLPGAVFPLDWWPDGSALLVRYEHEGRDRLYRLDLGTRDLARVADPEGTIDGAAVRPDGEVWMRTGSSVIPPRILAGDGREVIAPEGERAPEGRPYRSFSFDNPRGQWIHAFVAEPEGEGPHPVVVSVHGGPEWAWHDAFDPATQAFVDHGYAVLLVNYRGSTGYGVAFRNALQGNTGFPETEDVLAGLDALITEGTADPDRVALEGFSWGGYLSLLNAGLNPDRWRCVIAGIPVGDYVACHYECSPHLRAWDLAILGGSPEELPDLYHERNAMTYIDRVAAPVLVIAGRNDSRCPIGQVMAWVTARRGRGGSVDLHLYDTGHHAMAVEEQIRETQLELDFLGRHVPAG